MNLSVLQEKVLSSPHLKKLVDQLSISQNKIYLKNLQGSSIEFIVSSIFSNEKTSGLNHLIILNDAEEAAYFHNSLENLTQALDLFYYPSSFKSRKNFRQLNTSNVMLRTEMLTKLSHGGNKKIIVTYPEALFEKVVLPSTLKSNIIFIKANDTINLDSIMELFIMYGFTRTDFVYEPGQFALRGGILDIYSFGNDKPYRVELFGNEVDSIRIFDPETQLSERKILQVSIIPNVETQFETGEKITLLEYLTDNTIVWLKDWEIIKEKIEIQEIELGLFLESIQNNKDTKVDVDDEFEDSKILKDVSIADFVPLATLERQLQNRSIVEFGSKIQFGNKSVEDVSDESSSFIIHHSTKPQPTFNRNFEMLISNLKSYEKNGFEIYIFAEQAKQLERLYTIFKDLNTEINFVPIASSIHEGFIDEDLKVVCYTDHQIFQRYHKYRVKQAFNKNKALTLKTLRELQPGDFVTHIDHGVGRYSGLEKLNINGKLQEAIRIIYKDSDILYVNINSLHKISKFTGKDGTEPKINKLGSDVWSKLKEKTKTKVKEIAFDLIKLYAQRKAQQGFAHTPDNYMQIELEASFIYEDTPDQAKAVADVKKDMESAAPMDRLVCGDVGFGKTEVAIRAAFKTVIDGKQAAI